MLFFFSFFIVLCKTLKTKLRNMVQRFRGHAASWSFIFRPREEMATNGHINVFCFLLKVTSLDILFNYAYEKPRGQHRALYKHTFAHAHSRKRVKVLEKRKEVSNVHHIWEQIVCPRRRRSGNRPLFWPVTWK